MKICKNNSNKNYTGNENTPLGRGYTATSEKVGTKMKGRDKKNYIVVKIKGGRKRWQSLKSSKSPSKKSPKRKITSRGDEIVGLVGGYFMSVKMEYDRLAETGNTFLDLGKEHKDSREHYIPIYLATPDKHPIYGNILVMEKIKIDKDGNPHYNVSAKMLAEEFQREAHEYLVSGIRPRAF